MIDELNVDLALSRSQSSAWKPVRPTGACALGDAQHLSPLQRVREDLEALDLIALPAPDVDHWNLGAVAALADLVMPEDHDGVAALEELVGGKLELVPAPHRLLEGAERSLAALVLAATRQLGRVRALPDEVVGPVLRGRFDVPLVDLVVPLAHLVDTPRHLRLLSSRVGLAPPAPGARS